MKVGDDGVPRAARILEGREIIYNRSHIATFFVRCHVPAVYKIMLPEMLSVPRELSPIVFDGRTLPVVAALSASCFQ